MVKEPKFKQIKTDRLPSKRSIQQNRSRVIKNKAVVLDTPVMIAPTAPNPKNSHSSRVIPIIENNEVIGIVYHCSCGEQSEILFELENVTS